jgi:hypothetical protein
MLISVTLNGVISKQLTLFLTLIGVTPNSETQTPMTLPAPETFPRNLRSDMRAIEKAVRTGRSARAGNSKGRAPGKGHSNRHVRHAGYCESSMFMRS